MTGHVYCVRLHRQRHGTQQKPPYCHSSFYQLESLNQDMAPEKPSIPARDSGVSGLGFNTLTKKFSYSSFGRLSRNASHSSFGQYSTNAASSSYVSSVAASRRPSYSSLAAAARTDSYASLNSLNSANSCDSLSTLRSPSYSSFTTATSVSGSSVSQTAAAFSANVTPPLPPVTDTHKEKPLTYGQLVALLWPVYGEDSYDEARRRYLAQCRKRKSEDMLEEERPSKMKRTVKKAKSLWSLR